MLNLHFQVAIKTIKKSKIETEADLIRIRREIQIMSSVQHPNIIHIYEGRKSLNLIKIIMQECKIIANIKYFSFWE